MALENYRDISTGGSDIGSGFQFEFYCQCCDRRWKSPFKPHRMGQFTGLLTRFAFLFTDLRTASRATGNFADMGAGGAKGKAFEEALERAQALYTECGGCRHGVCDDCYDSRQSLCNDCIGKARAASDLADRQQAEAAANASAHSCPSCHAASNGGRFCAECGYDMASAFKGCPTCGAMSARNARFCGDCGHGF